MSGPHLPGRGGLLIALLASLLICSAGVAQPFENCPNPKGGDCFVATPGIPGCQFQSCCEAVCADDPGCCENEWDEFCAGIAKRICTFCGPGNGDCFEPNGTPGCDDAACCEAVCDLVPSCCEQDWDAICVQVAEILCSCKPGDAPANDDCADAIDINEGDTPFTTLCATADGPKHPGLPCGQVQFEDLGPDVWFHYTATFTGTARAHTCNDADYNTELAVYDECACPIDPDTILGCDVAGKNCLGFGSEVIFDVVVDHCYTIRVGGVGTASGTGTLSVEEHMPPKAPPNDDCANALVLMLDQPTVFDSFTASTDGFPSGVCNFFGQTDIKKDVWYDFTPNTDGTFQVSLCGSSFDTKLAVYEGCACPTPVNPIVCNDDFCDTQSRVSFTGVAGQCYKIRAGSFPGDPGGPGQIEIIQTAGCPGANTVLTHSLDVSISPDNSVACLGQNNTTADNAYARSYDLSVLLPGEPIDVTCVVWGIQINTKADVLGVVNLYRDFDGGPPVGLDVDLELLASQSMLIPAGTNLELKTVTFDPPVTIQADIVLVVELALPDTNNITGVWVGSNPNGQTAPGYIRSDFCGFPTFIDIADIPDCRPCADMHIVNRVIGFSKAPPACPWDIDGSGIVGANDLLALLFTWGPCDNCKDCPADFDGNCIVGANDLLDLLFHWGPCP